MLDITSYDSTLAFRILYKRDTEINTRVLWGTIDDFRLLLRTVIQETVQGMMDNTKGKVFLLCVMTYAREIFHKEGGEERNSNNERRKI